ncbi:alpha-hydroxy-acid oxidizing protein [Verrucomicrobiaceae bacterium 5K15]|uniref:Alpha-hydroxy-acid oxidizing protein n=1 Tax=Oceaniferula flava TaxID=2800421 RepID=A0AAE2SE83_9BACT|nr:alpha-hydroxy acid oxidase [Oceaniferula flavus]MBK1854905.1 alpha-hydroxy-acid oxidizing protein [Oceaniferula flavus]MBM1136211.1 alpha-hydroxy-acid oxidizing protein [Oceaniferula flavus]
MTDATHQGVIPADAVSLADYQRLASKRLSAQNLAYLNGGAGSERTLRANTEAWGEASLWPRVLRKFDHADTRTTILNRRLASPLLIGPTAYHKLFHPEGEIATATAASALRTPYIVSTQASTSVEDIANQADGTPLWFQLYIQHDKDFTKQLIRRVEQAGYEAIVLTVDAPVHGIRNAEQRSGFRLSDAVEAVNLRDLPAPPQSASAFDPALLAAIPSWQDVAWLRELTTLPIFIKGILHPADAVEAIDHGADGLIVSNHGGRTLDQLPATRSALPHIVAAVEKKVPVLVDGGIRCGSDVLQALALGADAVLLGRPILHGLTTAGAAGVAHVLKLLQHELEVAMLLTGCRDLSEAPAILSHSSHF